MYPLQGPSGENEPDASERARLLKQATGEAFVQAAAIIGVAVGIFALRIWRDEDGARLQALHSLLKILQDCATMFGKAAIKVEQVYNDTAKTYG